MDPEKEQATPESQFRALRRRLLIQGLIVSVIGVALGIAVNTPVVWGLGILGIVVTCVKLIGQKR